MTTAEMLVRQLRARSREAMAAGKDLAGCEQIFHDGELNADTGRIIDAARTLAAAVERYALLTEGRK